VLDPVELPITTFVVALPPIDICFADVPVVAMLTVVALLAMDTVVGAEHRLILDAEELISPEDVIDDADILLENVPVVPDIAPPDNVVNDALLADIEVAVIVGAEIDVSASSVSTSMLSAVILSVDIDVFAVMVLVVTVSDWTMPVVTMLPFLSIYAPPSASFIPPPITSCSIYLGFAPIAIIRMSVYR